MLDKSLPYIDIIMRRPVLPPPSAVLPGGYRFALFGESIGGGVSYGNDDGYIRDWAEIETSVLEFSDVQMAEEYLRREFLPYRDELRKRMLFVITPDGKRVGTATAWWNDFNSERTPWVHWVSVRPEYQGLGLGRAVIYEAVRLLHEINGDKEFYLHTQTWSHKAVLLYESAGFEIVIPDPPVCIYSPERLSEAREIIDKFRNPEILASEIHKI
ncbi:MAG: GNAT family N-acetyltransferase [Eubacteriales bacterium]